MIQNLLSIGQPVCTKSLPAICHVIVSYAGHVLFILTYKLNIVR